MPSGTPHGASQDDGVVTDGSEKQIGETSAPDGGAGETPSGDEDNATLCRLQLVEPDLAKARSPYPSFPELVATFGLETRWVMSVVDRYGTPTSLAYLARVESGVTRSGAPQPPVQE